jgi:hypothetical protein
MADDKEKQENKQTHEKRILNRVNHNNIDLSHHAKHDWQTAHNARRKAAEEKAAARTEEYDPIYVRAYFQELDRVGDEGELVPANDPELDPLVPELLATYLVEDFPGGDSAMQLLAEIQNSSHEFVECSPDPADPNHSIPYYVSSITIGGVPYPTTDESGDDPDNPGYDPDPAPTNPPYDPGEDVDWLGKAWMFFDGPCGVPVWDPNDNDPWDKTDPNYHGPDGEDGYPNGTLDMYAPLTDYLLHTHKELVMVDDEPVVVEVHDITFSYERQCFDFKYEEQEVNGEKHMALVIQPMRRKKSKK